MNKTAYLLGLSGLIPFVGLTKMRDKPLTSSEGKDVVPFGYSAVVR
jgi:hypothetical protein